MDRREFHRHLFGAAGMLALRGLPWQAPPRVDGARITQHLAALGEFGKNPQGGVSRVAYTEADRQGGEAGLGWMREADLNPSIDAAGSLVGRRPGHDPSPKPLVL